MRRFTDVQGAVWDAVVGRESWGTLYALFIPVAATGTMRRALLQSAGYEQAQQELAGLDDEALHGLFQASQPFTNS